MAPFSINKTKHGHGETEYQIHRNRSNTISMGAMELVECAIMNQMSSVYNFTIQWLLVVEWRDVTLYGNNATVRIYCNPQYTDTKIL